MTFRTRISTFHTQKSTFHASAIGSASGDTAYIVGTAATDQLTKAEVKEIASKFLYSNPQYYFLTKLAFITSGGNTIGYSLDVYPEFAKGEDRQAANTLIEQKLAEYYEEIDACGSDEEKVRKIHDLMLEKIEPIAGATIYEALVKEEAQCEGYTELFQILEGNLQMWVDAEDIYITRNGKVVAKLSNPYQDRVDVAKSLFGILPADMTLDEAREERLNTI